MKYLFLLFSVLLVACGQVPLLGEAQTERITAVASPATPTAADVAAVNTTATLPATATPLPTVTLPPTATPLPSATPPPTATVPPSPTPLPVSIRSANAPMLLVAGDMFPMGAAADTLLSACEAARSGCDRSWFAASEPVHTVTLDQFYIDVYEVDNAAYLAFLNELGAHEGACDGEKCVTLTDSQITLSGGQYTVPAEFADHPVTGVTWYGAAAYCTWRDARLPTEAEWEMAAGWDAENGVKLFYPWGNDFVPTDGATAVNFCDGNCGQQQADSSVDDGFAFTAPVSSFGDGRSPTGAYNMAGNVWEWVSDWFAADYYSQSPDENPQGPESGSAKVVRGGSWFDTGNFTSTAVRFPAPPAESSNTIGFRCALDAIPQEAQVVAQAPETTPSPTVEATAEPTTATTATAEATTPAAAATATPIATATATAPAPTAAATQVAQGTRPAPIAVNCEAQPGLDLGDRYVVGACDWLAKIARQLGVSYAALLAANPQISNPDVIVPGQVLNVPSRTNAPATTAVATTTPTVTATAATAATATPGPTTPPPDGGLRP